MKKAISLLLVLCMFFMIGTPAFAADGSTEEIKEDLDTTYVMSNPPRLQIAVDGEVVLAIGDGTNHTSVGLNFSSQDIQIMQIVCIGIVVIISILIVQRKYYVKK
ncbi:MAG: hypothetical protein ACLUKQ_11225 [Peptococcaceae bacterium]